MLETSRMSDRGQIVIPKQIRDAVGAKEDAIFAMTVVDGTILMKKLDLSKEFREIRAKAPKYSSAFIDREIRAHRNRH